MKATRELRQIPADPNAGYMLDNYADRDRLYLLFDLLRPMTTDALARALLHARVTGGGEGAAVRLLDVGCGEGLHLADAVERHGDLGGVGLDRDPEAIATATAAYADSRRLAFHRADIAEPIPATLGAATAGRGFDVAQLFFVLQHLRDATRSLSHIHEALRPGGVLVVCDMFEGRVRLPHPSFEALFGGMETMFQRFGTPRCAERHQELLAGAGFTMCESRDVEQELGGTSERGRLALTTMLLALRATRRAYVDGLRLMEGAEFDGHLNRLAAEVTPEMAGVLTMRLSIARKE